MMRRGVSAELHSPCSPGHPAPQADVHCEQPGHAGAVQQPQQEEEGGLGSSAPAACGLLCLSEEVLLLVLGFLEPFSLLRAGGACWALHRISSSDSLWAKHCRTTFASDFRTTCSDYTLKEAFKLLYMWGKLYKALPYNRQMQDLLFSGIPPKKYWVQWLVLEEMVPLPPIQLADHAIEDIWGINKDLLDEKHKVTDDSLEETKDSIFRYDWKELYNIAIRYHGNHAKIQSHVLQKISFKCHEELEWLYCQYSQFKFQWLFSYWLFGLSKSCAKQLQKIYLWWKKFNKRKVSCWGTTNCDVRYLASLHYITDDYWNGKLADGDEHLGIQTVENYFSMCKSLLAWIQGRNWGRFKQKKIYENTVDGVYRLLKCELQVSMINHDQFWHVAKVQMSRICNLEEMAGNYVNWRLIDLLPCYRDTTWRLCSCPLKQNNLAVSAFWSAAIHGSHEGFCL
ncbi:hypothetical protein FKM82_010985 [Ascaphus truei]